MLPYLVYKHVQKRNVEQRRNMDDALDSLTSNLSRSLIPDQVMLRVSGVCAKLSDECEETTRNDDVPGILCLIERSTGVFIEWSPRDGDDAGWVVTTGSGQDDTDTLCTTPPSLSPAASPDEADRKEWNKLRFSLDVNDLSSFRISEPKRGRAGHPCIRLICRDGTNYVPLLFKTQPTTEFVEVLQRYVKLRRSLRDSGLVLVVDEKAEQLAKSVSMLDQNGDMFQRFMSNPYATAMTGLGKIGMFVQDQVIPSLLDSDEVSQEESIRAMRELRAHAEAEDLRVYSDTAGFEMVTQLELPPRPEIFRESPVTAAQWASFRQADGTMDPHKLHHLKMNVFRGGIEASLRRQLWPYLLGYRQWDHTDAQHEKKRAAKAAEYNGMKQQWQSISAEQESRFSHFANRKALVEKDVARTDRTVPFFQGEGNANLQQLHNVLMTYCMYNFDLGYVQGMSDFLSPLLYVMQNEVDAFWCFVGLMDRVHRNFEKDQSMIKQQLNQLRDLVLIVNPKLANYLESHQSDDMYFCFRWVLVWFKREFSFEDTCKLWEVLWTWQPCGNFLLLLCVAILDRQTDTIIENNFGLTEILKHVNDLSGHLVLDEVLTSAEAIFHQLAASQDKLPGHICVHLGLREGDEKEEK